MCPRCGKIVYLTVIDPSNEQGTRDEVAAICVPCQEVFFIEEWRQLHLTPRLHLPADS